MKKTLILSVITLLSSSYSAQAAPGDMALGLKTGTLGIGLEATFEVADKFNVRVGGNYFKLSSEVDVEGNDYDLDLKLNSFTAIGDWHVMDGIFRVSAGAVINKNGLNGAALSSNTYEIDDTIYTADEVGALSADVKFTTIASYLGIGWGNALADDSDWTFMADMGVIFAGKPKLDVTSTGGTLSNDQALLDSIAQAETDFKDSDELKYLKIYPVISVGVSYRF